MAMLPNPLPRLADDLTGGALGLRLPQGRLIDETDEGPWHEPLLWCAEDPAGPDTWQRFLPARAVGLHPVLIEFDEKGAGGPGEWELAPQETSYPGDHAPEDVLAELWGFDDTDEEFGAEKARLVAPFGREWPGLAPESGLDADSGADAGAGADPAAGDDPDPDDQAAAVAEELVDLELLAAPRLALVHARRSADIPAAIGWSGPVNHVGDVAELCAVLRSWEDRFGIRVVALSFDTLTVSVASPPRTLRQAEALAAEHLAFCPDNITQGRFDTLSAYAEHFLLNAPYWRFWWD